MSLYNCWLVMYNGMFQCKRSECRKGWKRCVSLAQLQWAGVNHKGATLCNLVCEDMISLSPNAPHREVPVLKVRRRWRPIGNTVLLYLTLQDSDRREKQIYVMRFLVVTMHRNCCCRNCSQTHSCVLMSCFSALSLQTEAPGLSLGCCVDLIPQVKVILASKYEE